MIYGEELTFTTKGYSEVIEITDKINRIISHSGIEKGIACISVIGSTASITTIEYEPALVEDFREKLNQIFPENQPTRHGSTWGDDNGFSHLRASFLGPSLTLPFENGKLIVGVWQQVLLVDHDNRFRTRKIFIQLIGE